MGTLLAVSITLTSARIPVTHSDRDYSGPDVSRSDDRPPTFDFGPLEGGGAPSPKIVRALLGMPAMFPYEREPL